MAILFKNDVSSFFNAMPVQYMCLLIKPIFVHCKQALKQVIFNTNATKKFIPLNSRWFFRSSESELILRVLINSCVGFDSGCVRRQMDNFVHDLISANHDSDFENLII